ncbi:MAG TPA: Na+/H+ antiporter subunit C [Planctomycetes bacterium]|nr:Na+/H+ antiporter subunit C [Planctomycetota bacterium]HIK81694.1 Na+/H+ antiporter subunit C [Planctomycetota bacterium]
MTLLGLFNHWAFVIIMMVGLYAIIARNNLVKKILGLGLFQTGIFLMYITLGVRDGAAAPILQDDPAVIYANPLPHVLILTAIVVSVSTMAVALALAIGIRESYGTVEADEVAALDQQSQEVGC